QRPLLLGGFNHAQVVQDRIHARKVPGFHEVRNREGRQQPYEGYADHDFQKRKASRVNSSRAHFFSFQFSSSLFSPWRPLATRSIVSLALPVPRKEIRRL